MANNFDPRTMSIVLTYGATQKTYTQDMSMHVSVQKFANPNQDECTIGIANLNKDTRNHLLTQLTPWNYDQARKHVAVYAGRESTGNALVYQGDITECFASQPPDIILNIKAQTCQWYKYDIIGQSANVSAAANGIAKNIADSMGLILSFQATDKNIANYTYCGSKIGQVQALAQMGNYDAYVDGNTLVCKDKAKPLTGDVIQVSQATGMIGQVEPTEVGVRVRMMFRPDARLGCAITVTSQLNPLLNGNYTVYKLGYELASRDTPYYTIMEATKRPDLYFHAAIPQA